MFLPGFACIAALPLAAPSPELGPSDELEEVRSYLEWLTPPSRAEIVEELAELAAAPPDPPAVLEEPVPLPAELSAWGRELVTHRMRGTHAQAVPYAERIEQAFMAWYGTDHYQTREARHYRGLLSDLATLDADQQAAFAEVYVPTMEIPRLSASGQTFQALQRALEYQWIVDELLGHEHPESASSLYALAALLHGQGEFELADLAARSAWQGLASSDLLRLQAMTLNVLSAVTNNQGDLRSAEILARASLEARAETTGREDLGYGATLVNLGNVMIVAGKLQEARELHAEALELRRSLAGPQSLEALNSLANLGGVERRLGRSAEARELLLQALEIAKSHGEAGLREEAYVHSLLAGIEQDAGDLAAAESYGRIAIDVLQGAYPEGHPDLSFHEQFLARCLLSRGDWIAAERWAERAYQSARANSPGSSPGAGQLLAEILLDSGRPQEALEHSQRALELLKSTRADSLPDLAKAHSMLALCYGALEQLPEACRQARLSRELTETIYAPYGAATRGEALRLEADLSLRAGNLEVARANYEKALALLESGSPCASVHNACAYGLGRIARLEGRLDEAVDWFEIALQGLEERRTRILGGERERALYAGQLELTKVARDLSLALLDSGRERAAFEALERGRALPLRDLMAASSVDWTGALHPSEDGGRVAFEEARRAADLARQEWEAARHRAEALGEAKREAPYEGLAEDLQAARAELRSAARSHAQAEARVQSVLQEHQLLDVLQPRSASGASPTAGLRADELLLAYLWDAERVLRFELRGEQCSVRDVAVGAEAVAELQRSLAAFTTDVQAGRAVDPEVLRERLLPSREDADASCVVIPDGPLISFPWEALDSERVIFFSASAHLLSQLRGRPSTPGRSAVVLGNPSFAALTDLPASAQEARSVGDLLASAELEPELLLGSEAALGKLEERLEGARIVHLATHGWSGTTRQPLAAGLALASGSEGDTTLSLEHLLSTWRGDLASCELVALSACDSGRGVQVGDSHLGLSWGFWLAGARCTLVSRWKVEDGATLLLMRRFYEGFLGQHEGRSVAGTTYEFGQPLPADRALAEARIWLSQRDPAANREDLRRMGLDAYASNRRDAPQFPRPGAKPKTSDADERFDFSHPRHWAAFTLLGSPPTWTP